MLINIHIFKYNKTPPEYTFWDFLKYEACKLDKNER